MEKMKCKMLMILGLLMALSWMTGCNQCGRHQQEVVKMPNERFFSGMKPYLQQGYEVLMVPKGRSMLPTIQDNADLVTLKTPDKVSVGDVVLAEIDTGHYVMHRIMKIHGDQVVLKGDHNKGVEHTTLHQIVAKMVELQPGMGQGQSVRQVFTADEKAHYRVNPNIRLDSLHHEEVILVDTVAKRVDMQHLLAFNEAAKLIWKGISHESFTLTDMVEILMQNYEVETAVAQKDCAQLLVNWAQYGLVETVDRGAIHP